MRTTFWCNHPNGFYFRVLGYGLAVERDRRVGFSERYGHKRVLRVGRWAFEWINRNTI